MSDQMGNAVESMAILGAGTWGLSLACLLHEKGVATVAWDAFPDYLADLDRTRKHPKLPMLDIPRDLRLTNDLAEAAQADGIAVVVASHAVREVCERLKALDLDLSERFLAFCSKGIEERSLQTMTEIAESIFGENASDALGVLSGPSHAEEVSRGIPTTVVAASNCPQTALKIQTTFFTPKFRVYTHDDMLGVEIASSLKNVVAIAAGICDGLGFGDNSKAALVTRGLAEMSRLGQAMGAKPETFAGLTGMGDLIVTAMSRHSRNRNFGEKIAQGLTAKQAQAEIGMVVEGIATCASAVKLAKRHGVDMPIAHEVYAVLNTGKAPKLAARDLMMRDPKSE